MPKTTAERQGGQETSLTKPNDWMNTGGLGADYSSVAGSKSDVHTGVDEIRAINGKNRTIGAQILAPENMIISDVGYNEHLGNFVRGITGDGARYDFFHNDSINVSKGAYVKVGDIIAIAGDTGVGNAHAHTSKSYPQNTAPEYTGQKVQKYNRDYVQPRTQQEVLDEMNMRNSQNNPWYIE